MVPDPESGEEYSYTWAVVSYPQDQQPGTIEGSNEKTLKLSQLSPGNYTFHITVKSQNSFGEALENLTVLARKLFKSIYLFCLPILFGYVALRFNEPPVAVFRTFFSNCSFTLYVAILDGRISTDDAKIASYK